MDQEERLLQRALAEHQRCRGVGAAALGSRTPEGCADAEQRGARSEGGGDIESFSWMVPELQDEELGAGVASSNRVEKAAMLPETEICKVGTSEASFTQEKHTARTPASVFAKFTTEDCSRKEAAAAVASKFAVEHDSMKASSVAVGKCRRWLQRIVASTYFELFFGGAIMTNALLIGVEVQWTSSQGLADAPLAFRAINHTYAVTFLVELVARVCAHGQSFFCRPQKCLWNYLDIFIVTCSMWEVAVDVILLTQDGQMGGNPNMGNVRIIRIVRITRLVRITRISRLMRFVKALRTLVYSIICTLKSLVWAMLLIVILLYVFGILFTQVTNDYLVGRDLALEEPASPSHTVARYWGSLGRSMTTLFKSVSGGVTWQDAVDPLEYIHWSMVPVFYMFISFAIFAVLNVVTGVFCQSAIESAQRDQDLLVQSIMANKELHVKKIQQLFHDIDRNSSGHITIQELEKRIEDTEVQAYFASLELDIHDAWTFFKLLDTDEGNTIQIEEFLLGCMRLRGSAKALDMAKLLHEQQLLSKHLAAFTLYVEHQFALLAEHELPEWAPQRGAACAGLEHSQTPA